MNYNPRTEHDNLGFMVCFHNKYNLGDKHEVDHNDYTGWVHMGRELSKQFNTAVILPLYLYDHSGITMATTPFFCQWDSGQVGFILASKRDVAKWFGKKYCTNRLVRLATDILKHEVEAYTIYLEGGDDDDDYDSD